MCLGGEIGCVPRWRDRVCLDGEIGCVEKIGRMPEIRERVGNAEGEKNDKRHRKPTNGIDDK